MTLNKTIENICKSKEGFFNISTIYVGLTWRNNSTIISSIYSNKNKNLDLNFDSLKKGIILKGITFDRPYRVIDVKEKILIKLY